MFDTKACERPFLSPYRTGIDLEKVLGGDLQSWYLQIIGVLRRAIEIGRIDITTNISVLYQYLCNPRDSQLNALYRIFWYLNCEMSRGKNPNMVRLVYDARHKEVDDRLFFESD